MRSRWGTPPALVGQHTTTVPFSVTTYAPPADVVGSVCLSASPPSALPSDLLPCAFVACARNKSATDAVAVQVMLTRLTFFL